eukprot:g74032.t1
MVVIGIRISHYHHCNDNTTGKTPYKRKGYQGNFSFFAPSFAFANYHFFVVFFSQSSDLQCELRKKKKKKFQGHHSTMWLDDQEIHVPFGSTNFTGWRTSRAS